MDRLLKAVEVLSIEGRAKQRVESLVFDSRRVVSGSMFFATQGTQSDGHDYVDSAVAAGAVAVVCQTMPQNRAEGVAYILVVDTNVALGRIASNFYYNPSSKLRLVGVTGTNGKTTTVTLLYDMFRKLGYKVGLISTVIYRIDEQEFESTHTTPDSVRLNAMLAQMVERGCEYCFMEVSSHSIVQHRVEGLRFEGGVFSNITHDHLDYHGTFGEYIKAKKDFFDRLSASSFALTNVDDRNGMVMMQNTKAKVSTYSLRSVSDFRCRLVEMHFDGMELNIDGSEVWVRFLGRFNAYNLTSVYATAILLGVERGEVLRILSELEPVNGRFENMRSSSGITAIVDYAHTPDALENVINTINEIRSPEQKLFIVVGCGGNRDAAKRPIMARIAAGGGDMAIFTSDNPRNESPEDIIDQMKAGLEAGSRSISILSRGEAIKTAVAMACPKDIILIAGKGHETYQEVCAVRHRFDDKEEVARAFAELGV